MPILQGTSMISLLDHKIFFIYLLIWDNKIFITIIRTIPIWVLAHMTPHLPIGNSRDQIVGPKPIGCTCNLSKKKNLNPLRTGKNKVIIISSKLIFISSIYNYLKNSKLKLFAPLWSFFLLMNFSTYRKLKTKLSLNSFTATGTFFSFSI